MTNKNWDLLGEKMRRYTPEVDADAAWQQALSHLAAAGPAPLRLSRLLVWKGMELVFLLLLLIGFWSNYEFATATPVAAESPAQLIRPESDFTAKDVPLSSTQPSAFAASPPATAKKRALSLSTSTGTVISKPAPLIVGPTFATPPTAQAVDSPVLAEITTAPSATESGETSKVASSGDVRLNGSVALLVYRAPIALARSQKPTWSIPASVVPAATSPTVALDLMGGVSQPATGALTTLVGLQLRLLAGSKGEIVLGANYQRITGMDLYWQQAEYDKDFGYPTGNAVERWLDNYGAWEYSLGYRYRLTPRIGIQSDLQLTILQERGIRERIQGDDFFLGSSRRSLVDRDFGLRLGLDYRLSRRLAIYTQYLQGLGDISPNNLYDSAESHRHAGVRVGLRFSLFPH